MTSHRIVTDFDRRVATEFFTTAREATVGASPSIAVMVYVHWSSQPAGPLILWTSIVCLFLAVRAGAATAYLTMDRARRDAWYHRLYGLHLIALCGTAVIWPMSLGLLGSGETDSLFFLRMIIIVSVVTFYLSIFGSDRLVYGAFVLIMVSATLCVTTFYHPAFVREAPGAPIGFAVYAVMLMARSRKEQARMHERVRAGLMQDVLVDSLTQQAQRDALTGTYNRGHLESVMQRLTQGGAGTFCVLMIDVDHFKQINDAHGHQIGDEVLRRLSDAASNSLRTSDLFGRWGGEEFLVVLREASAAQAHDIAERLRQEIEQIDMESPIRITASIGVAQREPHEDYEAVVRKADLALYKAKHAGRNRCCVYEAA